MALAVPLALLAVWEVLARLPLSGIAYAVTF